MLRVELESTLLDFKKERMLKQHCFIVTCISSSTESSVIVAPIEKNLLHLSATFIVIISYRQVTSRWMKIKATNTTIIIATFIYPN